MTRLDQLLFTWRSGGFRPVAATGRLAAASGWLVDRARRLCRYERPAGLEQIEQTPISYGWWTEGDTRWVFRRGYLGTDPMGRPGNFFAHVLVGARDELPAVALAERFASPFWWDGGDPPPADVFPVELSDIPREPVELVSEEQLASFLAAVLHGGGARPVVLRTPPASAVACMASICRLFPDVFDDLQFSTYEAPQHASEFHIVGMHAAQSPPSNAVVQDGIPEFDVTSTVRRLVSVDPKDRHIARIVHAAALAEGRTGAVARLAGLLPPISSGASGLTSAARRLRIADRLELLRSAAEADVDEEIVAVLLGNDPADLRQIADCRWLPSTWRGRALAAHVAARPAELAPVLDRLVSVSVLGQDADLGQELARALPGAQPLIRMLRNQRAPMIESVTVATIAGLAEPDRVRLITDVLRMLEPARRPTVLWSVLKRVRPEDRSWDGIVAAAATDAVEDALTTDRPERAITPASKYVLQAAGGVASANLLSVISELDVATQEWAPAYSEPGLVQAREALARIDNGRQRRVLGQLALAVIPVTAAGWSCIADTLVMIQKALGLRDTQFADLLLRFAVRYKDRSPFPYLAYVITMVRDGRLSLTRGGIIGKRRLRLESAEWQDHASRAALRLAPAERMRAEQLAGPTDQQTWQWWETLND